jgi:hypothetical protein
MMHIDFSNSFTFEPSPELIQHLRFHKCAYIVTELPHLKLFFRRSESCSLRKGAALWNRFLRKQLYWKYPSGFR